MASRAVSFAGQPGPGRLRLPASLSPGPRSDMALEALLCSDRPGLSCVKLGRQRSPDGASPSAGWQGAASLLSLATAGWELGLWFQRRIQNPGGS